MMIKALCVIATLIGVINSLQSRTEPMCTSHFDYMDKLHEKVVRFELKITRIESQIKSFTETMEDFKEEFKSSKDKNTALITEHTTKISEMENNLMASIEAGNQTLNGLKETVDSEIQAMIAQSYQKFKEIKDESLKRDMVFQVKDIASQPTANSMIKFTTVISNTDNVYNLDTGFFIAPDNGTYWFAVHFYTNSNHYFVASIYLNDKLINRGYTQDEKQVDSFTVTAVVVMKALDRVYVKSGSHISPNPIHTSVNYLMNTFMGARVN